MNPVGLGVDYLIFLRPGLFRFHEVQRVYGDRMVTSLEAERVKGLAVEQVPTLSQMLNDLPAKTPAASVQACRVCSYHYDLFPSFFVFLRRADF